MPKGLIAAIITAMVLILGTVGLGALSYKRNQQSQQNIEKYAEIKKKQAALEQKKKDEADKKKQEEEAAKEEQKKEEEQNREEEIEEKREEAIEKAQKSGQTVIIKKDGKVILPLTDTSAERPVDACDASVDACD